MPDHPLLPTAKNQQLKANPGYALLSLILVIIILFILMFIPLQLISVLNTRSTISSTNSRIVFHGTESAIHDALSRLVYTNYTWPGIGQTLIENLTFSGVNVSRTTRDNANNSYSIDALGTYRKISRHLSADISSNSIAPTVDVIIVIDASGSMNDESINPCDGVSQPVCQPLDAARQAAKTLIDEMIANGTDAKVGLYIFGNYATQRLALTTNLPSVKTAIDNVKIDLTNPETNIGDGIYQSQLHLDANARGNALTFIVLLSDGVATYKGIQGSLSNCYGDFTPNFSQHSTCSDNNHAQSAITRAQVAKNSGHVIFTVGLNIFNIDTTPGACTTPPCGAQAIARDTLTKSATTPEHYYEAPTSADLLEIFRAIATEINKSPSFLIREIP